MVAGSRFAKISDSEISEMNLNTVPKTTQSAIKHCVKLFERYSSLFSL